MPAGTPVVLAFGKPPGTGAGAFGAALLGPALPLADAEGLGEPDDAEGNDSGSDPLGPPMAAWSPWVVPGSLPPPRVHSVAATTTETMATTAPAIVTHSHRRRALCGWL